MRCLFQYTLGILGRFGEQSWKIFNWADKVEERAFKRILLSGFPRMQRNRIIKGASSIPQNLKEVPRISAITAVVLGVLRSTWKYGPRKNGITIAKKPGPVSKRVAPHS